MVRGQRREILEFALSVWVGGCVRARVFSHICRRRQNATSWRISSSKSGGGSYDFAPLGFVHDRIRMWFPVCILGSLFGRS